MSIQNYLNFETKTLSEHFRSNWSELSKGHPGDSKGKRGAGTPKTEAARCAELYTNAKDKKLFPFIVLGETNIRQDVSLMKNLGTIATMPALNNKIIKTFLREVYRNRLTPKEINTRVNDLLKKGAVLNEGSWFILPNDMVMLGIIHSGKECHIATIGGEIPSKEDLWDEENCRPRVLGRELLQLYHAGYRLVEESFNGKGIVMLQVDEEQCKSMDLVKIRKSVKATYEDIQEIFINTVPFRETTEAKKEIHPLSD